MSDNPSNEALTQIIEILKRTNFKAKVIGRTKESLINKASTSYNEKTFGYMFKLVNQSNQEIDEVNFVLNKKDSYELAKGNYIRNATYNYNKGILRGNGTDLRRLCCCIVDPERYATKEEMKKYDRNLQMIACQIQKDM